jgi:hypothetical protein
MLLFMGGLPQNLPGEQPIETSPLELKKATPKGDLSALIFWWPVSESNQGHADFQSLAKGMPNIL